MAGNGIQVGSSDNAIRVKSNGIVVAGVGDACCCTATDTCIVCADSIAASQYQIVIAGWTSCGCVDDGAGTYYKLNGDLNGTWTVDFLESVGGTPLSYCRWTVETDVVLETYSTSDCSGTPDVTETLSLAFVIKKISTTYYYQVVCSGGGAGLQTALNTGNVSQGSSAPDCLFEEEVLTILYSSGECGTFQGLSPDHVLGYGGTATITPI